MKRAKIGNIYYLTVGLIIFPVGTLLLLRQPSLISLISNLMPSIETVEIFGLFLQFLGEGLICYGVIGIISSRIVATTEFNRQILIAGISKNTQDQNTVLSGLKRNMEDQIAKLRSELSQMQFQKVSWNQSPLPSSCRFCGATITQSRFCPQCGKAN